MGLVAISAPSALASETDSYRDSVSGANQLISDINRPQSVYEKPAPRPASASTTNSMLTASANAVAFRRATLMTAGTVDWALFSEMNVDFYFDWTRVVDSSGWQRVGAAGFNTVQALGINRTYTDGWKHSWRAQTDMGVGVPTPWGYWNATHQTLTQFADVYGDGAWNAWR